MKWDRIIEEKIQAARAEGKFDNLPGHGKPLNLDDNPFADPAWEAAYSLMKEGDFRPDWLEADVVLRAQLQQAQQALKRSREWRVAELATATTPQRRQQVEEEWQRAVARFREALQKANKQIATLNLKVPNSQLQRAPLNVDAEIEKVLAEAG